MGLLEEGLYLVSHLSVDDGHDEASLMGLFGHGCPFIIFVIFIVGV